jgi:hypothetical protein
MGYRSEVAVIIADQKHTGVLLPEILNKYLLLFPEQLKLILNILKLSQNKNFLYFYDDWIKWYRSEDKEIIAIEDFFIFLEDEEYPVDAAYVVMGEDDGDTYVKYINDGHQLAYPIRQLKINIDYPFTRKDACIRTLIENYK